MGEFSDSMRSVLGSAEYIQNAFDQGAERKRKNSLAALASQYYAGGQKADPQLLSQIAANGGDAGGFQKQSYGNQDRQREQLGQIAALLVKAPPAMRPQIWESQVKPGLIAMGLPAHGPYSAEYDALAQQLATTLGGREGAQLPADIQTMEYYKNNPEQFARAKELRQASANPFGFQTITGEDGIERLVQTNKREGGAAAIGPGGVPQGAGAGPQGTPPNIMDFAMQASRVLGGRITSGYRTEAEQAALRAAGKTTTVNSQHNTSTGVDMTFPNVQAKAQAIAYAKANGINVLDEGNHVHFGIPRSVDVTGPNPYASRPVEQQAALTTGAQERAKIDAQVGNTDRIAQSEATVAAAKSGAEVTAKSDAERIATARTNLPKVEAATKLITDALTLALKHPGREAFTGFSSINPVNKIPGTDARSYEAVHNQIKGQTFLQAFEQLKGAGQITEVEGEKATNAIGRLDAAQSDEEYEQALIDLKGIANRALIKAKNLANGGGSAPSVTTQAQFDALPSGAIYVEDGVQYRKP